MVWASDGSGLLNLMHECAHFHAFQKRQGSDLLGHWLLGPLALADFEKDIDNGTGSTTLIWEWMETPRTRISSTFMVESYRCFPPVLIPRDGGSEVCVQVEPQGFARRSPRQDRIRGSNEQWQLQGMFFLCLLVAAGPAAGRRIWPQGLLVAIAAYTCVYLYGLASLNGVRSHSQSDRGTSTGAGAAFRDGMTCSQEFPMWANLMADIRSLRIC